MVPKLLAIMEGEIHFIPSGVAMEQVWSLAKTCALLFSCMFIISFCRSLFVTFARNLIIQYKSQELSPRCFLFNSMFNRFVVHKNIIWCLQWKLLYLCIFDCWRMFSCHIEGKLSFINLFSYSRNWVIFQVRRLNILRRGGKNSRALCYSVHIKLIYLEIWRI